jgi:hypothetical protein
MSYQSAMGCLHCAWLGGEQAKELLNRPDCSQVGCLVTALCAKNEISGQVEGPVAEKGAFRSCKRAPRVARGIVEI